MSGNGSEREMVTNGNGNERCVMQDRGNRIERVVKSLHESAAASHGHFRLSLCVLQVAAKGLIIFEFPAAFQPPSLSHNMMQLMAAKGVAKVFCDKGGADKKLISVLFPRERWGQPVLDVENLASGLAGIVTVWPDEQMPLFFLDVTQARTSHEPTRCATLCISATRMCSRATQPKATDLVLARSTANS